MKRTAAFLPCFLLALSAAPATGATFFAVNKIELGPCDSVSNTAGSANAVCDNTVDAANGAREIYDLTGRSEPGDIGVEANLTLDATSSRSAQNGTFASVSAGFFDTLTFGIESGTFRFSVDIDGTLGAGVDPVFGGTAAAASIRNQINGITVYERRLLDAAFPSDTGIGTLGTTELELAFVDSTLDLDARMTANVDCDFVARGDVCTASSAFLNSLRFTGGEVFDVDGSPVTAAVFSESGFDYLTGIEPHGGGSDPAPGVVPLPASAWFLVLGVAGLAGLRARQRGRAWDRSSAA